MKKKNSKPSLTNSTKHLLKCPVTKPSFPLYSSPNISFKTTPKLQTQPQNFFCLFVKKKLSPIFLPGWLDISFNRRHRWNFYTFKNILVAKLFFCDTQPPIFGQKLLLTPPTATPTSVTVVTTLRRRNVPNSNYYEKNFDSQKSPSKKKKKFYVKLNKSQPKKKKLRRMNSFLAQRVRKTTMTIMIRKKRPKKEEFWIKALKMTEIVNENRLIVWTEVRFLYHLILFSFAEIIWLLLNL